MYFAQADSRLDARLFDALAGVPDAGVTAEFDGETHGLAPSRPGMIRIRVAAVASKERRRLENRLFEDAIPALLDWVATVEAAGHAWRSSGHWFAAGVRGAAFAVRHDPLPPR